MNFYLVMPLLYHGFRVHEARKRRANARRIKPSGHLWVLAKGLWANRP